MNKQWREFKIKINLIPSNVTNEVFCAFIINEIKNWHKQFPEMFEYPSFVKLKKYLKIDINNYPIKFSCVDQKLRKRFIKVINEYEAKDRNFIAYSINSILQDFLVYQIDTQDNPCESGELGILKNKLTNKLVYMCMEMENIWYIDASDNSELKVDDLVLVPTKELLSNNVMLSCPTVICQEGVTTNDN